MVAFESVITSWSDQGEALYGGRFIDGFARHWSGWPADLRIWKDEDVLEQDGIAEWRETQADAETSNRNDFHRGVMKWSWKVFALTGEPAQGGWRIWIDGDVEFKRDITMEFFDIVCPDGADVSFLGRPWAYASETGFVAYNTDSPSARALLRMMRHTYLSGEFRELAEWGDAAVFDHCRRRLGDRLVENDLTPSWVRGGLHIWPESVLGEFMEHQKGPIRKRDAYGGVV